MFRSLVVAAVAAWTATAAAQAPPYLHLPQTAVTMSAARELAVADRQAAGASHFNGYRYLWLPAPASRQQTFAAALAFSVVSASRDQDLDGHRPVEIAPGLFRIDLDALQWDQTLYNAISCRDPFRAVDFPLVVRGDWLVMQLASEVEGAAYQELLYGKVRPKNRDEFLAFWKVDKKNHTEFQFGMIEEKSGVSVFGTRWLESWPTPDARMWGTRDIFDPVTGKNLIEQPDGQFKHDGEEWIAAASKYSKAFGIRGHTQVYQLAAGDGSLVKEAPGRLVRDHTQLFGHEVIINPGSCHSCHASGLNYPTSNAIRRMISDGVEIYDFPKARQQFIDRFHLTDTGKLMRRQNEDFSLCVRAINGLTPEANTAGYQALIRHYLKPVSSEVAAIESGSTPEELRNAIAFSSGSGVHVGGPLADLAHGRTIPRRDWELKYQAVRSYLALWRASK